MSATGRALLVNRLMVRQMTGLKAHRLTSLAIVVGLAEALNPAIEAEVKAAGGQK